MVRRRCALSPALPASPLSRLPLCAPTAFYGQNTRIRDTLNNLILKSPEEWQTNVGLPFFRIEGTSVEWDELHFDVRLLQRVPYEGVSRMSTSLRRRHRDRVVRCAAPPCRLPAAANSLAHRRLSPSFAAAALG